MNVLVALLRWDTEINSLEMIAGAQGDLVYF